MSKFIIKEKTYSNNMQLYCPQLFSNGEWYFIDKNGLCPLPNDAPRYNAQFKLRGVSTMQEAERIIDSYLYTSNICLSEKSYEYNPIQQKSINIGGFTVQQIDDIKNLLISLNNIL